MPGGSGRLVVLDRAGRPGRVFVLQEGAATIGRSPACDLRVLLPTVAPHHATIVVHSNQTIIRNVGEGETLVNGQAVSVSALQEADVIQLGERCLRWHYDRPPAPPPAAFQLDTHAGVRAAGGAGRAARAPRRHTAAALADAQLCIRKTLEMQHRASMPGNAGGKQVAIVQPQRRDTSEPTVLGASSRSGTNSPCSVSRSRTSRNDSDTLHLTGERSRPSGVILRFGPGNATSSSRNTSLTPRSIAFTPKSSTLPLKPTPAPRSSSLLQNTTKASLWIESRKSSPRKVPAARRGTPPSGRKDAPLSARKATPLRLAVLRKAQSAHKMKVTKIEAPLKIDAMKQAALMLMAGHGRLSATKQRSPTLVVKSSGGKKSTGRGRKRGSRSSKGKSVSVLEITDTTLQSSATGSDVSTRSKVGAFLPSPRKSALKDPKAKKSMRKNESIKFDLSNLESHSQDEDDDVLMVSATSRVRSRDTVSTDSVPEEELTLHYSDSSTSTSSLKSLSPSPRRSIHSRASRMLEQVGSPLKEKSLSVAEHATLTPESPQGRRSLRGSLILQKALEMTQNDGSRYSRKTTKTFTDQSFDTTSESAFKTRTISPRSAKNMESYSIVDLVSIDSNESGKSGSVYDSIGSTRSSSIMFGTPQGSSRKTRSTIDPTLLTSSTPYGGKTRASVRSNSSPNIRKSSPNKTATISASTRRSKSLTTPENSEETQKHISINSTRISRASRSRSRINDSDLQFLNSSMGDSESPKTSRRNTKADQSIKSPSPKKASPQKKLVSSPETRSSPSILTLDTTQTNEKETCQRLSARKSKSHLDRSDSRTSSADKSSRASRSQESTRESSTTTSTGTRTETSRVSKSQKTSLPSTSLQSSRESSPRKSFRTSTSQDSSRTSSPQISNRANRSRGSSKTFSLNLSSKRSPLKSPRVVTPSKRARTSIAHKTPRNSSPVKSARTPVVPQDRFQKTPSPKKSPTESPVSSQRKRSSRSNLTLNMTQTTEEGIVTPENQNSPIEVGTPVLRIQNLLDSSQSSFTSLKSPPKTRGNVDIKRKTIGVLRSNKKARSGIKSRSFNTAARKSLRSGRISPVFDGPPSEEENVTPKSAVKLIQEAVKNKHSTAKKPQSKRSIIDNLNESDIVKQLFNSPVKRKLSQSMTEFSRKRLFDEDETVPRRPTRNTVALSGRTPETSILDNTHRYTPENFVSPLSTPSNSPNLTGIKRLYAKNTPQNDLSNVKGVKSLLRTPRTRKSVRNDLTKISGVKAVFAKSPRDRLSDVRVKEVFAPSPKNDLRRVTGVKSLFQSEKKRTSPRNDLSDVRGVKRLFARKSGTNDLRNVTGVKKTLEATSPKNDLRDIRGVKKLFQEERHDASADLSGVEELFNVSNISTTSSRDPEALFDQLIGKPPIKAVYSKSFITKRPVKRKIRRNSLRKSIELITTNVEEWIQQELQKNLHKDKLNQSKKANVTRELQKLVTDTVEGTKIRASRVRNSTILKSTDGERKRTASEMYSAHTLPIKKRSFVEASMEKSADDSRVGGPHRLPIKKRLVVHSTPVKGRCSAAMNASELARVSPIAPVAAAAAAAALDGTRAHAGDANDANRSKQLTKTSPLKGKRATRTNIIEESLRELVEETQVMPPKPARSPAKANTDDINGPQTQKKTTRNTKIEEFKPVSPKSTRISRIDNETTSTQAKKISESVNQIAPNAPKLKGRKTKASLIEFPEPKSLKRTMVKVIEEVTVEPKPPKGKSPKNEGHSKAGVTKKASVQKYPKPKRGRSKANTAETVHEPKSRRTRNKTDTRELQKESPKKVKSTKGKSVIEKEIRGGKIAIPRKGRQARAKNVKSPVATKAAPKIAARVSVQGKPSPKKTRGTRAKPSPTKQSPEKPGRSLRDKVSTTEITHTKKRRQSLVVTKRVPVMSPKQTATKTTENAAKMAKVETPKKTTRRNAKAEEKPKPSTRGAAKAKTPSPKKPEAKSKTPKATRAKLVVPKPSPKLNPRSTKATRSGTDLSDENKKSSPAKQSPPKRGRRNVEAGKPEPKTNETKNAEAKAAAKREPAAPARRARPHSVALGEPPAKRARGKNTPPENPPSPKKTRRGKVSQEAPVRSTRTPNEVAPPGPRRGRKRKSTALPAAPTTGKVARPAAVPPAATGAPLAAAKAKQAVKEQVTTSRKEQSSMKSEASAVEPGGKRQTAKETQKNAGRARRPEVQNAEARSKPDRRVARTDTPGKKAPAAATRSLRARKVVASPAKAGAGLAGRSRRR